MRRRDHGVVRAGHAVRRRRASHTVTGETSSGNGFIVVDAFDVTGGSGSATVSIDGGEANAVDTAGAAAPGSPGLASEPVFSALGLAAGSHRLVITVTGETSTGGAHVIVDAFDVTP